jgi:hypothetical protein
VFSSKERNWEDRKIWILMNEFGQILYNWDEGEKKDNKSILL